MFVVIIALLRRIARCFFWNIVLAFTVHVHSVTFISRTFFHIIQICAIIFSFLEYQYWYIKRYRPTKWLTFFCIKVVYTKHFEYNKLYPKFFFLINSSFGFYWFTKLTVIWAKIRWDLIKRIFQWKRMESIIQSSLIQFP